ncbi:glycosyl transferases group 1 [bacterium BMS3Abin05]|nr:glycosyl transferases group 1 [bacterium BMS3Abin05]GBE27012.1 glycosyl transferases group 1 [bacterium BMS3Bbin03]HDL78746.1 glycosyltransferase [Bacteroidota bacterium]
MKILFLTSRWPVPPITGDRIRAFYLLRHLTQKHDVTLVSFYENFHEIKQLKSSQLNVRIRPVKFPAGLSLYARLGSGLFSKLPLQVHYYSTKKIKQVIHEELKSNSYDLIFVHLLRMANYVMDLASIPKIIDLTDAISLNYERLLQFSGFYQNRSFNKIYSLEKERVLNYEKNILRKFNRTLLISGVDKDYLQAHCTVDPMAVVQNGVNLDYFKYLPNGCDSDKIVFHGNMNYLPNVDAALYFYRDIFPLVKQKRPRAKFFMVGVRPKKQLQALEKYQDVFVTGRLNDLRPQLRSAALAVCPLRAGAGLQNKILEAMAIGTPVVTTSLGLEGIHARPGKHLEVADTPEAFAEKVVSFMNNPGKREEFSRQARQFVEENYTWEKALAPLDDILNEFE